MNMMNDFKVMFSEEKKLSLKDVYEERKVEVDYLVRNWELGKYGFKNNELMVAELILKLKLMVLSGKGKSESLLIDVVGGVFDRHLKSNMSCRDFSILVKKIYKSNYLSGVIRR